MSTANTFATIRRVLVLLLVIAAAVAATLLVSNFLREGQVKAAPRSDQPRTVTTTVVDVVDGDTVVVAPVTGVLEATSQRGHTLRILGIDAPEMKPEGSSEPACGAQDATWRLERLLKPGTTVTLVWDTRADRTDRYGRALVYLEQPTPDGPRDVGALLVQEGFVAAWYPSSEPRPERADEYERLEQQAQNRGSWPVCGTLGRP